MDILEAFAKRHEKLNIYDFFQREYKDICLHNAQIKLEDECWEGLRNYWTMTVDEFVVMHPMKKVTKNLFKVDWEELYNSRIIHNNKKRIRNSVIQTHTSMSDSIANENPFLVDTKPNICNIVYTNKIESVRKGMKYEPTLSKQDLLYYNILDFVSKNKENGTVHVLGDTYDLFKKENKLNVKKNKMIGGLVKDILAKKQNVNLDLKQTLKTKKKELRDMTAADERKKALTKRVIKGLKVYQHLFEEDIHQSLSEDEYMYLFVRPLMKIVLKDVQFIKMKCGESNLRCAAKRRNKNIFDEERRSPGPKIDMIFIHKLYEQEIATLEVSGPDNKINNSHFHEDRNKTAKNLKHILKAVIGSVPPSSLAAIKRLKVHGFHLYENTFYIYSLSTPNTTNYIFSLEYEFQIPMTASLFEQNSPNFFSKLWIINDLFIKMNNCLKEVYEESLAYSTISTDSDAQSSPNTSPKKKQKTKNSS